MGVSISSSSRDAFKGSIFVNDNLATSAALLASDPQARSSFTAFIKDGSWIEQLAQMKLLQHRQTHDLVKPLSVSFHVGHMGNSASASPTASSLEMGRARSGSTKSTSEGSSKSACQEVYEPLFVDLYAVLEERTCFTRAEMTCFLFSVLFPLYISAREERDQVSDEALSQAADYSSTFSVSHNEESSLFRLQDICLSAAASADEGELVTTLSSTSWLHALNSAVANCPLCVCICTVNADAEYTPVLVNTATQKRMTTSSLKSPRSITPDFLQIWGIDPTTTVQAEVYEGLAAAQPLRLVAAKSVHKCKTVLDVTHIFDEHGVHRYVLGVLMDVPDDGTSAKHLQYLTDSALLISHIVKTSAVSPTSPPVSP